MATPVEAASPRTTPSGWARPGLPLLLACLLAVAYAVYFGWYSLAEYWSYQMHALDMGNMSQAAWNTIHGRPFYFTNMRLPTGVEAWGTTTRLSFHVEALFPFISLVYLLDPHPESLLVLQTVFIASGGIAVYLLARDMLARPWLAVVFSCLYFLFPALESLNLYEFHPVALATPLLIWAFWFGWHGRAIPFLACGLAAMGTKEQIGITVAVLALYLVWKRRLLAPAIGLAAFGVVWSLLAAFVIEKHFRPAGTISYLHSRYGYLGHGLHGVLSTLLHHPGAITSVVLTWAKLGYAAHLLAPVGFIPLAAPLALVIALPSFLLNVGSQSASMYSALGDNSAELVSAVMISAVLGARWLLDRLSGVAAARTLSVVLGIYLASAAVVAQLDDGFTPLGPRFAFPAVTAHDRVAARFVDMIPAGVPVSTQDQLDPHLSDRQDTYLFPDMGGPPAPDVPRATRILLDVSAPTIQYQPSQIHQIAMQYLQRPGWGVAAADDGLILIEKGAPSKRIPARFYRFMQANRNAIQHRLHGVEHDGLQV